MQGTQPRINSNTDSAYTITPAWNGNFVTSFLTHMSHQLRNGSHWGQLSDELSSMIFPIAAQLIVDQGRGSRELYKLPLVCTRFASIFKRHPYLHECIRISRIASTSLPSLLIWIRQYGSHVNTYIHFQDCSVQVVLGALFSRDAPLRMVELDAPSEAIPLVSAFTTLQQCKLHSSRGKLDLEPLQALPNLHDLYLADGNFHNVHAAARLTNLQLSGCSAHCSAPCLCVTSLQHLLLEHEAILDGFHEEGVAASCHLQELYCNQSIVYASRAEQHMRLTDGFPQLPASLTGLICLTQLHLEFEIAAEEISLACLTSLGALQSLEVVASSVALPLEFSAMTSLRRLSVDTSVDDLDRMFSMALYFDWQSLVSLEHVDLCGNIRGSAQFRLSDMTSLNRLKSVKVTGWYEPHQIIRDQLAELFYRLGRNRPDVLWHM